MIKVGLDLPDDLDIPSWGGLAGRDRFPDQDAVRAFGDRWLSEGRSAMSVPSAVIPEEPNLLLNPLHPDFARVTVAVQLPFRFDERLAI